MPPTKKTKDADSILSKNCITKIWQVYGEGNIIDTSLNQSNEIYLSSDNLMHSSHK